MKRFIFGERNGIYIIDLQQTLGAIETAYGFVRDLVADGGTILFIGTKKQAQDPIRSLRREVRHALRQRALARRHAHQLRDHRQARRQDDRSTSACGPRASSRPCPRRKRCSSAASSRSCERNLGGIRNMSRRPDAVFVLDTKKEHIAVTEANKLGIPVVAVVDTNCDPDVVQYVIPGNDDAIRAGTLMCRVIADAVEEGRFIASKRNPAAAAPAPTRSAEEEAARRRPAGRGPPPGRRRPGRARGPPGRRRRRRRARPTAVGSRRRPSRAPPSAEPSADAPRPSTSRRQPRPRPRSTRRRRRRRRRADRRRDRSHRDRGGLSRWRSPPRTSRPCARPPAPG